MGQLEPIKSDVSGNHEALAEALRTLFAALDISITRYAARCNADKATISRYLSGARVPPWQFVKDLIAHVTEARQHPVNPETVATVRDLYVRAAGTAKGQRRSQDLQHLLEEADQQAREAASLERLLRNALQEAQQQVNQLNVEIDSLQAARAADRQAMGAAIERYTREADDLRSERDALAHEVELLKHQLKEAVTARLLAEEKCDRLERQIEEAESHEEEAERFQSEEDKRAAEEKQASTQQRIDELELKLSRLRTPKPEDLIPTPPPAYVADHPREGLNTIAASLGYGPGDTLRRVEAARKQEPRDILRVLKRSIELQSKAELIVTRALLRGMPGPIVETFEELTKSPQPAPAAEEEWLPGPPHE
ncbi:hypothetical protein [Streptomyces werraensis]|uniref:Uncharacterized protein n=1 Tax=Streptomyces werraensis TaxID=68284 RepID=A0ABV3JJU6_9ACTN